MPCVSCAEQSSDGCTKQAREGGVCVRYEEGGIAVYMVDKECQEAENEHIKLLEVCQQCNKRSFYVQLESEALH